MRWDERGYPRGEKFLELGLDELVSGFGKKGQSGEGKNSL